MCVQIVWHSRIWILEGMYYIYSDCWRVTSSVVDGMRQWAGKKKAGPDTLQEFLSTM